MKSRLGTSLPRPLLARLADASGGNPFYALEMARALAPDGDLKPAQPLPVPRNLEELVVSRVQTLSAPARQLALAAAATSQPTRSVLASALCADADFGAALLEAEEAGVLTSEDDRIRFEHPLLASVIYGSASPERRRQLHKRLALVVSDPEERARHLALCTTEPDEEIAAELEASAALAARRGAQEAAAELFAAADAVRRSTRSWPRISQRSRLRLCPHSRSSGASELHGVRSPTKRARHHFSVTAHYEWMISTPLGDQSSDR